jgi:hypothetical protein
MRLLSRLLVVIAICLAAIALPETPAQAQDTYIMVSPNSGVPGEEVTVYGYNFTHDEWVDIYYYLNGHNTWVAEDLTDEGTGNFRVTFTVPESYTGPHDVLAEDEFVSDYDIFTVKPGLTVSPEEGAVGTTVTVEGHGFAEDEENIELRYYFNGDYETIDDDITADDDGWWELSFQIPPSAQGHHDLDAGGDDSSFAKVEDADFEVTPGISINKSSGSPGNNITMTGSGFAVDERDITILFDEEEVVTEIRADETGYWQEDFQVPERPKGEYSVTAEGERTQDTNELSFEIEPGLVLSPGQGYVGMNLTVAGRGFAADEDVDVIYEVSLVATTETNENGSFDVSFPAPESRHGARLVTAEDAAENEATAIFTMESDPPDTPELISPPDGGRAGFIGKVRPTFEWSGVSDASGVYYSLQIATSANVTATGEFVGEPVFSVEGLVGTNYTMEETEALPYGTYYWIVQAVDGAENESGWTEARSFRAGLLPLWAFIVIIVAIAGGIGALVYFFIIRRRIYYY